MKLATTTGDFTGYTGSQIKSLQLIREAGFRYADYNFGYDFSTRSGVYAENHQQYFEEIQVFCEQIGIKLVQAHSPMGTPLTDPDGSFLADTIRCVQACGAWGIPNLVVHSGYTRGLTKEQTFAENKKFFEAVLAEAEKYSVNILVENFNKMVFDDVYWIDNATDLLALIEYVDHPLFHAVWDMGHGNLQPMPQHEELILLGEHVRALHVQDNMGDRDSHLQPYLGTLNPDSVMYGLEQIGYKGYFTFEVGGVFTPFANRKPFDRDTRLANPPLALKCAAERYLYELGKCVLEAYDCFEE